MADIGHWEGEDTLSMANIGHQESVNTPSMINIGHWEGDKLSQWLILAIRRVIHSPNG
jgi:hypothetical protein